jgi:hypothetical protein
MLKPLLLLALPLAAACTPVDYGFGETQRALMAQQVVDPDPQYAEEIMEGGSGEVGAAAVDRYHKGEVRQPAQVTTTTIGGRGGNSGSSTGSSSGPQ